MIFSPKSPLLRTGSIQAAVATLTLLGCPGGETPDGPLAERPIMPLELKLEQRLVLATSALRFELPEDARLEGKSAAVTFSGERDETEPFEQTFSALVKRDEAGHYVAELVASEGLFEAFDARDQASFWGSVEVEVLDPLGVLARGRIEYIELEFRRHLKPRITQVAAPGTLYPGDWLEVKGEGFLRPEEGQSWAVVERGELRFAREGGAPRDLSGERVPIRWERSRRRASLFVSPLLVGIEQGEIEATLRFENVLRGGEEVNASPDRQIVNGQIAEAFISSMTPRSGSRGDLITIEGRGFLEGDEAGRYGMYLRYEGQLYPAADPTRAQSYFGAEAIKRVPYRVLDAQRIEEEIWYEVDREARTLSGLGAVPGRFEGKISPVLTLDGLEEIGKGLAVELEVRPPRQVVWMRFLPSFTSGLERYGLRNVSVEIEARALEIVRRDYAEYNVEVRSEPPEDTARSMTLEIGGADPTGMNLLGYDNSYNGVPKDTGNLFLEDYLGGYNRPGSEANFSAYGGVFTASFVIFSPTLWPGEPGTDVRFDEVFGAVMPELGGNPVRAAEWPVQGESERTRAITRAIRTLGTLIGHTASHEIGHALGLPFIEGERADELIYHNRVDTQSALMDSGSARPFRERAELDDAGPSRFNAQNDAYLRAILPKR